MIHAIMRHDCMDKVTAMTMLKTVGSSGQLSLGKRYAGMHFQVVTSEEGVVTLTPVSVTPVKKAKVKLPQFKHFKVDKIIEVTRDELHDRSVR